MTADDVPIEGQILLLAGAKASVPAERLPALVARVQDDLGPRLNDYRRRSECVHESDGVCYFLVEPGHWKGVADRLAMNRREAEAVRRAHREQLRRLGRREDRADEFDAALDIRECVIIGT